MRAKSQEDIQFQMHLEAGPQTRPRIKLEVTVDLKDDPQAKALLGYEELISTEVSPVELALLEAWREKCQTSILFYSVLVDQMEWESEEQQLEQEEPEGLPPRKKLN